MDRRRRYVPGSEGLEGRMMLSATVEAIAAPPPVEFVSTTLTSPAARHQQATPVAADPAPSDVQAMATATATAAQRQGRPNDPNRPLTPAEEATRLEVIEARLQRIERLPAFLELLDPGRPLPEEAIATIQQELRGFVGQLRPPAEPIATGFIVVLRDAIAETSVKPESVAQLNYASGRLLASAGASEQSIERITESMTELARSASGAIRPVVVMTNDYALVLQTALGVGRPISRLDLLAFRMPGAALGTAGAPGGIGGQGIGGRLA